MIPILYAGNEKSFTTEGLGRLGEIQSCIVTEERNGIYEVEFTYPVNGRYYSTLVSMVEAYSIGKLRNSGIIACIHDDNHDVQPFDIYSVSTPIDGVATFNAHHISYRLSGLVLKPFEATGCSDAFNKIQNNILGITGAGTNGDEVSFTFSTNKSVTANFKVEVPKTVRSILGGEEGSILDVFGTGEYKFDKFNVSFLKKRGTNSGVTIRYGVNLIDITREIDSSGHYNAVCPFWEGDVTDEGSSESTHVVVTLTQNQASYYVKASELSQSSAFPVISVIDFSQDFDSPPTDYQLRVRAQEYLTENKPWLSDDNIKVSFVQLWQTTDYQDSRLQPKLALCDYVTVYYEDIGIVAEEQEVIKAVYNVILERYDEFEIGKPLKRLADDMKR